MKVKRIRRLLVSLLCSIFVLCSCGSNERNNESTEKSAIKNEISADTEEEEKESVLTPEQEIRLAAYLGVPEDVKITEFEIGEAWYWEETDIWLMDVRLMNGSDCLASAVVDSDTLAPMKDIILYGSADADSAHAETNDPKVVEEIGKMNHLVRAAFSYASFYDSKKQTADWIYDSDDFWGIFTMCGIPDENGRYMEGCLLLNEEDAQEITYALVKGFNGSLPEAKGCASYRNGMYYLNLWQPELADFSYDSYTMNEDGSLDVCYDYVFQESGYSEGKINVHFENNSYRDSSSFDYPYTICYFSEVEAKDNKNESSEYVLLDSDKKYLSESDLVGLSKDELRLARNEIYARKGRKFDAEDLKAYFNSKSWYKGTIEADYFTNHAEELLNVYEIYNITVITKYEEKQ